MMFDLSCWTKIFLSLWRPGVKSAKILQSSSLSQQKVNSDDQGVDFFLDFNISALLIRIRWDDDLRKQEKKTYYRWLKRLQVFSFPAELCSQIT